MLFSKLLSKRVHIDHDLEAQVAQAEEAAAVAAADAAKKKMELHELLEKEQKVRAEELKRRLSLLEKAKALVKPINSAFVFIKPHANTTQVRMMVGKLLLNKGFKVTKKGMFTSVELKDGSLFDKQFMSIAKKALVLRPANLVLTSSNSATFLNKYGEYWHDALRRGVICNAVEACERFGIEFRVLGKIWNESHSQGKSLRLSKGFHVSLIDHPDNKKPPAKTKPPSRSSKVVPDLSADPEPLPPQKEPIYVVNGFYPFMRSKYFGEGQSVYYLVVEWDDIRQEKEQSQREEEARKAEEYARRAATFSNADKRREAKALASGGSTAHPLTVAMSWRAFRHEIIGSNSTCTEPVYELAINSARPNESLRAKITADWKNLGLKRQPDAEENCVHASASAFEAVLEKISWLGGSHSSSDADNGDHNASASASASSRQAAGLFSDPLIAALMHRQDANGGGIPIVGIKDWLTNPTVKGRPLLEHFENLGFEECVEKAKELYTSASSVGRAIQLHNSMPVAVGSIAARKPVKMTALGTALSPNRPGSRMGWGGPISRPSTGTGIGAGIGAVAPMPGGRVPLGHIPSMIERPIKSANARPLPLGAMLPTRIELKPPLGMPAFSSERTEATGNKSAIAASASAAHSASTGSVSVAATLESENERGIKSPLTLPRSLPRNESEPLGITLDKFDWPTMHGADQMQGDVSQVGSSMVDRVRRAAMCVPSGMPTGDALGDVTGVVAVTDVVDVTDVVADKKSDGAILGERPTDVKNALKSPYRSTVGGSADSKSGGIDPFGPSEDCDRSLSNSGYLENLVEIPVTASHEDPSVQDGSSEVDDKLAFNNADSTAGTNRNVIVQNVKDHSNLTESSVAQLTSLNLAGNPLVTPPIAPLTLDIAALTPPIATLTLDSAFAAYEPPQNHFDELERVCESGSEDERESEGGSEGGKQRMQVAELSHLQLPTAPSVSTAHPELGTSESPGVIQGPLEEDSAPSPAPAPVPSPALVHAPRTSSWSLSSTPIRSGLEDDVDFSSSDVPQSPTYDAVMETGEALSTVSLETDQQRHANRASTAPLPRIEIPGPSFASAANATSFKTAADFLNVIEFEASALNDRYSDRFSDGFTFALLPSANSLQMPLAQDCIAASVPVESVLPKSLSVEAMAATAAVAADIAQWFGTTSGSSSSTGVSVYDHLSENFDQNLDFASASRGYNDAIREDRLKLLGRVMVNPANTPKNEELELTDLEHSDNVVNSNGVPEAPKVLVDAPKQKQKRKKVKSSTLMEL